MSTPLTHVIGRAERSLSVLLTEQLDRHDLTFAEWTVGVFLAAGPLPLAVLVERLAEGRIAGGDDALARLRQRGWTAGEPVALTPAGEAGFAPVRAGVAAAVAAVTDDLDADDLAATRRVLAEVTARAQARAGAA